VTRASSIRKIIKERLVKTIWKYPLAPEVTLEMPLGAKVLCVHLQHADVCLWALVDSSETRREKRYFAAFGTGHELPLDPGEYIGTVLDSLLVFHIFEVKKVKTL
jgi:hypothetical protein